jgi:hypothetical protein
MVFDRNRSLLTPPLRAHEEHATHPMPAALAA